MADTNEQAFAAGYGSAKMSLMAAAVALTSILQHNMTPSGELGFDRDIDGALASIYGGESGSGSRSDAIMDCLEERASS